MAYKSDINKSILNRNNFRLLIDKVPTVEYYVRTSNIPGVQFSEAVQAAGLGLDAFFPGDKASFDTLEVSFIVNSNWLSNKYLHLWSRGIQIYRFYKGRDPVNFHPLGYLYILYPIDVELIAG